MEATPELERVYADILANPEDDAPRLRYADLVGGDRAELIRVGIQLRDLRREGIHGRDDVGTARHLDRIASWHPEWADPVRPLVGEFRFRRGFVEDVTLSADEFLERAAALYAVAPVLTVRLTQATECIEALMASSFLERLRALDLSHNKLRDHDAAIIASSPYIGRLRWLDLSGNKIGESGIDALARATRVALPELRYLGLWLNAARDPSDERLDLDHVQVAWEPKPEGDLLEMKYGPLKWLHHRSISLPTPDAF